MVTKGIFILFIVFTNFSYGNTIIDLANTQLDSNEHIIHDLTQQEIIEGELSQESIKLIKETNNLRNEVATIEADESTLSKNCGTTDPEKKKKKKKAKKKIDQGWVIIASTEVSQNQSSSHTTTIDAPLSPFQYNNFYSELRDSRSIEELQSHIKNHTKDMTEQEYFSYLAQMATRLPYNNSKAEFNQDQQGVDSIFDMLSEDRTQADGSTDLDNWGGICGDIHFFVSIAGETARPDDYEYFTASYAMAKSQHVYSFAVSKNDPDKIIIVNYSSAQIVENSDGIDSALIRNRQTGSFNNLGAKVRLFKNSGSTQNGQAEHVATLPTALGRYLEKIHQEDHQRSDIPNNDATNIVQVDISKKTQIIKTKGEKEKVINIEKGLKLLKGTIENQDQSPTDIFSVALFVKRAKNTDGFGNVLDPKNGIGTESNLSLSASSVRQQQINVTENYYFLRLNYFKGYHKVLLSSDKVNIQANTGFNINADYIRTEEGDATADGDLQTFVGLGTNIKLNEKTDLQANVKATSAIGLKEERSIYEFNKLPKNVKLTTNVLDASVNLRKRIDQRRTVSLGTGYTGTQVGGLFSAGVNYQINSKKVGTSHYFDINYTKPTNGVNRSISSNLLSVGNEVNTSYGLKKGRFEFGGTLSYDIKEVDINKALTVSGKLKIKLDFKKKKKTPEFNF